MNPPVVILGCGYTGQRLARRLSRQGRQVITTSRQSQPAQLAGGRHIRFDAHQSLEPLDCIPAEAQVVYSIPVLEPDPLLSILRALGDRPSRMVYLSTTGVYGSTSVVDEHTEATPNNPEGHARIAAEQAIRSGPWSSLVLRPAAIYGPGRGVHVRMQQGTFRLGGDGSNYVSRIHVDDLAAHADRALNSDVQGAWPVADELPATSREVAEYCSTLLDVPLPEMVPTESLHPTRRANRRVDGSGIRRVLSLSLEYPTFREGIPAALAAFERG